MVDRNVRTDVLMCLGDFDQRLGGRLLMEFPGENSRTSISVIRNQPN